jgi:hypothetical protein
VESGEPLSLMNIAAQTLLIANVFISLEIVIFTKLNPRSHSSVLPSNVVTTFGKGAKATGNFTPSSILSFNPFKADRHFPNGIVNTCFQYLFRHISDFFCDL